MCNENAPPKVNIPTKVKTMTQYSYLAVHKKEGFIKVSGTQNQINKFMNDIPTRREVYRIVKVPIYNSRYGKEAREY